MSQRQYEDARRRCLPSMRDWVEKHLKPPTPTRTPKVRTPASDREMAALKLLRGVTYSPATAHKRFAYDMHDAKELTERQRAVLWSMVWRYRRQIGDAAMVTHARDWLDRQEAAATAAQERA